MPVALVVVVVLGHHMVLVVLGSPIAIETNTAKTYAAGGAGGENPANSHGDFSTGDGGDSSFNASEKMVDRVSL